MPGSGKSEAVKFLESKEYYKVYFGGATLEEIKKRGLEVNEENEKKVREELRQKFGMGAYAQVNLEKIEKGISTGNVVIDGLYSWSEYKVLKEKFGENLNLIAIVAPKKLRQARLADRPVRPLTKAEVESRDFNEIENLEKGGPIAIADYTIVNNGTLEELHQKIDEILSDIEE